MLAAYAKRNNPDIRFGELIEITLFSIDKEFVYGKINSNSIECFKKKELYFPDHPKGYNQPCFK